MDWSSDLAYAVGLLTTDGNLSPDGRHFDLTSTDIQLLEVFKRCLGLSNRIASKRGGFGTTAYRIQFGDVGLYQGLLEIGLTPKKSKTLGALDIPDEWFADFLRGHLDGDGSIRVYQDPDYPNSQRLYTMFYSASKIHLEWLQSRVNNLWELNGYINERGKIWGLFYAKQESLVLLKEIYYASNVPCLLRKRELIEQFL